MNWEDDTNIYNDPIVFLKRTGTPRNPYKYIKETVQIVNGIAHLREVPERAAKVRVTGENKDWFEVENEELEDNFFQVDYVQGNVFFTAANNGKTLTFEYNGTGVYLTPDSRVYLTQSNDPLIFTANEKFADINREILEQKNRVDTLITENPQPSEVVDMRIDRNGNIYDTARDRINAEQKKIEDAYVGNDGRSYTSLKERYDTIDTTIGNVSDQVASINGQLSGDSDTYMFPFYTPQQKGAVGDGQNDDTAAIQSILNIAKTKGSVYCYIPRGTYRISAFLRIYNNTKLIMDQDAVILRGWHGGFLINGDNGATYSGYDGHGNILIEGGTFDGNIGEFPQGFDAIGLARGRNITIRNVIIKDTYGAHCIDMNACRDVLIDNCRFVGYFTPTPSVEKEAIQIAEHSQAGFSDFGSYDCTPCYNITIKDCYFGKSTTANTTGFQVGIGQHSAVNNMYNSNIKIINNHFEDCAWAGVRTMKYDDVIISGNTFERCDAAVRVTNVAPNSGSSYNADGTQSGQGQSGARIVITGNIIKNCTSEGIRVTAWGVSTDVPRQKSIIISDNIITHDDGQVSQSAGIYTNWSDATIIKGNYIQYHDTGISIAFSNSIIISENIIYDITNEGIESHSSNDTLEQSGTRNYIISIMNNTISGTGKEGINIRDGLRIFIHGNRIDNVSKISSGVYDGIFVNSNTNNGSIMNNYVRADNGNYGIECSGTTRHIQVFNNEANGLNGNCIAGGASWEGYYAYNTNKTKRYRVSINSSNQLTITEE